MIEDIGELKYKRAVLIATIAKCDREVSEFLESCKDKDDPCMRCLTVLRSDASETVRLSADQDLRIRGGIGAVYAEKIRAENELARIKGQFDVAGSFTEPTSVTPADNFTEALIHCKTTADLIAIDTQLVFAVLKDDTPILSGAVYQASRALLDSAAWTLGDLAMAIIHKKWEAANASIT